MGQSTNAILAYGYNVGGGESEWNIEEADEDGDWTPPWVDPDDENDLITAAETTLLAAAGFTETDWRADGYYERKEAAEAQVGVEFESHCSGDYPMWLLVAHTTTVYRGDVKEIDFAALEATRIEQDWDAKLRNAADVLGMTPKQESPRWMLVSYWG